MGPRKPIASALAKHLIAAAIAGTMPLAACGDDGEPFPGVESGGGNGAGSKASEGSGTPERPLYSQRNLRRALELVERELGRRARVLQLRLAADNLQVTGADSERPPQPRIVIVRAGGGVQNQQLQSITGTFFSLEAVRARAPARLTAAVEERSRGQAVDYMVLRASPVDGRREWVAFAGGQGFRAQADGSRVRRLGQP